MRCLTHAQQFSHYVMVHLYHKHYLRPGGAFVHANKNYCCVMKAVFTVNVLIVQVSMVFSRASVGVSVINNAIPFQDGAYQDAWPNFITNNCWLLAVDSLDSTTVDNQSGPHKSLYYSVNPDQSEKSGISCITKIDLLTKEKSLLHGKNGKQDIDRNLVLSTEFIM